MCVCVCEREREREREERQQLTRLFAISGVIESQRLVAQAASRCGDQRMRRSCSIYSRDLLFYSCVITQRGSDRFSLRFETIFPPFVYINQRVIVITLIYTAFDYYWTGIEVVSFVEICVIGL